jgi:hypothetical protein
MSLLRYAAVLLRYWMPPQLDLALWLAKPLLPVKAAGVR